MSTKDNSKQLNEQIKPKKEENNNKSENKATNLGVLEDDDEFEEFEVEDWNEAENNPDANLWDDNWDDDDIEDDFSKQLKEELAKVDNKMQS